MQKSQIKLLITGINSDPVPWEIFNSNNSISEINADGVPLTNWDLDPITTGNRLVQVPITKKSTTSWNRDGSLIAYNGLGTEFIVMTGGGSPFQPYRTILNYLKHSSFTITNTIAKFKDVAQIDVPWFVKRKDFTAKQFSHIINISRFKDPKQVIPTLIIIKERILINGDTGIFFELLPNPGVISLTFDIEY